MIKATLVAALVLGVLSSAAFAADAKPPKPPIGCQHQPCKPPVPPKRPGPIYMQ